MDDHAAAMSGAYASAVIGNLHVVRWLRSPTVADLDTMTREIELAAPTIGRGVVSVTIVSAKVEPPDDRVRKRMLTGLDRLLKPCESVHCVIEGSGFRHVVLCSVVTSLILVGGRRKRMFVHGSFDDFLRETERNLTLPAAVIAQEARTRGLVAG